MFRAHLYSCHRRLCCSNLSDHDPLFHCFFKSIFNLFPCLLPSQVHTGTLVSIGLRLMFKIIVICSLTACIGAFPSDILNCVSANCKHHQEALESYAQDLVSSLLDCTSNCFPTFTSTRRLMGWKYSACFFKKTANLWYEIWEEAGCPTSGVLFQIKKNTKTRYKYEVRRLKCRQNVMLQKKLALLCGRKNKKRFWSEIHRLNHSHLNLPPVVDGVSGI